MGYRGGQLYVAHPVAPDTRAGYLDAAPLADNALEADALVLTAVALPVLGRTEDALAEQPVLLGAERPVVDGLGLGNLATGPLPDLLGRSEADGDLVQLVYVYVALSVAAYCALLQSTYPPWRMCPVSRPGYP